MILDTVEDATNIEVCRSLSRDASALQARHDLEHELRFGQGLPPVMGLQEASGLIGRGLAANHVGAEEPRPVPDERRVDVPSLPCQLLDRKSVV